MNMKRIVCLFIAIVMVFSIVSCKKKLPEFEDFEDNYVDSLPEDSGDGLTLHAFNWTFNEIRENLGSIANAGFKNILTMPVQQPKAGGSQWWAFYQPLSFSIAEESSLGTKEDLKALCEEAEQYGICILVDIVANHMATTDDEGKEEDGTPMVLPEVAKYEPILYANRNEDTDGHGVTFHHNKKASGSGSETQYYQWGNLPDLNTANPYVQGRVLSLLQECIDIGVDGFRFDAAKHIETSEDPDYSSDFWEKTVGVAKQYYKEKTGKDLYVYGEILTSPLNRTLEVYTSFMRVTDDGFTSQFKNTFSKKDALIILNATLKTSDPSKLIAWVESHDEYVTASNHYGDNRIAKYWAVIAAKGKLGGLYLARPTDDLDVGKIGSYAFENENVAISNRFHNRFVGAETYESAEDTIYVNEKVKGDDMGALVINVGEVDPEKTVEVSVPHLADGNYYDALTGKKVVVYKQKAYINFEANGLCVMTRSKDLHPVLSISEKGGSFVGEKEITFGASNCDKAYYWFNDDENSKKEFTGEQKVAVHEHLKDSAAKLSISLITGKNTLLRTFEFRQLKLKDGGFNVLNLNPKYLNGDFEIYIWSWSPGKWSKDYKIEDGVLLFDPKGAEGFLIAVFEKGYVIGDPSKWDSNILKQSGDIKGDTLKAGFVDMTGF